MIPTRSIQSFRGSLIVLMISGLSLCSNCTLFGPLPLTSEFDQEESRKTTLEPTEKSEKQSSSLSPTDKKRIEKIQSLIKEAGDLYKLGKFKQSGRKITAAQNLLKRAIDHGKEDYRELLEKEQRRLSKANGMLTAKSIALEAVPEIPAKFGVVAASDSSDLKEKSAATPISFKREVVPILLNRCGSCHVGSNRGDISFQTYDKILDSFDGKAVVPGNSRKSEVVKLMERRRMPPPKDNNAVPAEEISLIRKWVQQGAKFDMADEYKSKPIGTLPHVKEYDDEFSDDKAAEEKSGG